MYSCRDTRFEHGYQGYVLVSNVRGLGLKEVTAKRLFLLYFGEVLGIAKAEAVNDD